MKKLVIISLLICTTMTLLAGCGAKTTSSNGGEVQTTEDTEQSGETEIGLEGEPEEENVSEDTSLTRIKERKTFLLGLDDSFPPMGFLDENNEIVGFDIDVAAEVCSRMGVELKLESISWDAKEQELNTKNIDCIWNGFTSSKSRAATMTLSDSYLLNKQVVVVLKESGISKLEDLAGKKAVVQNGSTAVDALEKAENKTFRDSLKEVVKVQNNVQALMDLKVKGSDAVIMDEVVARYYTEKEPGIYTILEETLEDEEYVIGFRKGEEALCSEVERQIEEMKEDGTLAEISKKWFGTDITIQ